MEYRGFEYTIVQSLSPKGWCWSVVRDRDDKIGFAPYREGAIFRAKKFIDQLIKTSANNKR
jgi:hypothetical protein